MKYKIKTVEKTEPLKIVCCLPGSNFSATFLRCWSDFLDCCYRDGIKVMLSNAEDAVVYYVRTKCLGGNVLDGINQKPFQGEIKYDYLLWIDSDIVFNYGQFRKLLSHNRNIVGGIYLTKGMNAFAVVEDWNIEHFKKNGTFRFLTPDDIKNKKDLIEVAYTGFGFLLVKYGVFESLQYPWFKPLPQKITPEIQDFSSEDVSFCLSIRQKGFKVYIDPTVWVGHEKRMILGEIKG